MTSTFSYDGKGGMDPEIEPIETKGRLLRTPRADWVALPILLFMLALSFGTGVVLAILVHVALDAPYDLLSSLAGLLG